MDIKTKQSPNGDFATSAEVEIKSDGVEIGSMVTALSISVDPADIVLATIDTGIHTLDIEGSKVVINSVEAPEEILEALRVYFEENPRIEDVIHQPHQLEEQHIYRNLVVGEPFEENDEIYHRSFETEGFVWSLIDHSFVGEKFRNTKYPARRKVVTNAKG